MALAEQSADRQARLVGLTGSLRLGSYSTAILRVLQSQLDAGVTLEIVVPRLPLFDEDESGAEALDAVRRFKAALAAADGLVICTPEYNHGVPGVLKNALDWASRPSGKSALRDKPVMAISNSPAFTGGVRAQAQLNETLLAAHAAIAPGRQVVIGGVADKFRDGHPVDLAHFALALAAVQAFANRCRQDKPTRTFAC